ncbi:MAG: DUF3667 domain-containing protein [Bacteroidota bacterium]|nr:DUF3667 domain-containing protein [Bacteroidota bacterium]
MEAPLIICKNCGNKFYGKYCNLCGEKVYKDKDKTIAHFFEDGLHFITHFEGTFFTTLKAMVTRPGRLSLDYCNGIRNKYFKPLSFFLLMVVIYLLFPLFEGLNMEMKFYSNNLLFGKFASNEIHKAMMLTGMSEPGLSMVFHEKAEKLSKFLLIVIIPLTALFFKAVLFHRRKYFFDYLVYATEVNIVFLFWGYFILPIIVREILKIDLNEFIVLGIVYLYVCIYVAFSAKKFFSIKWFQSIIISILFFLAHNIILLFIYKFILFVLTILQIN